MQDVAQCNEDHNQHGRNAYQHAKAKQQHKKYNNSNADEQKIISLTNKNNDNRNAANAVEAV